MGSINKAKTELEALRVTRKGNKAVHDDIERTLDSLRRLGVAKWDVARKDGGIISVLKKQSATYDGTMNPFCIQTYI